MASRDRNAPSQHEIKREISVKKLSVSPTYTSEKISCHLPWTPSASSGLTAG